MNVCNVCDKCSITTVCVYIIKQYNILYMCIKKISVLAIPYIFPAFTISKHDSYFATGISLIYAVAIFKDMCVCYMFYVSLINIYHHALCKIHNYRNLTHAYI